MLPAGENKKHHTFKQREKIRRHDSSLYNMSSCEIKAGKNSGLKLTGTLPRCEFVIYSWLVKNSSEYAKHHTVYLFVCTHSVSKAITGAIWVMPSLGPVMSTKQSSICHAHLKSQHGCICTDNSHLPSGQTQQKCFINIKKKLTEFHFVT